MKIAIIGRSQFLYGSVVKLKEAGHEIKSIITSKASPEYKKTEKDFQKLAESVSAAFFCSKNLDEDEIMASCKDLDIGISVNWTSIIQEKHINLFKLGILNAHFGDLPKYRGNACPNWAIINGEKEVFVSIHFMEGGKIDCGRVVVQKKMELTEQTYIGDVYAWGERAIAEAFQEACSLLEKDPGSVLKYADPESTESFRCYPRKPEDSRIDWKASAEDIQRLVRASSAPFQGAYGFLEDEKIVIWKAETFNDNETYSALPGQISDVGKDHFTVITGKSKLKVTEWEYSKKIRSIRQRLQ